MSLEKVPILWASYADSNDNGLYDDGETFIDSNGNGEWDGSPIYAQETNWSSSNPTIGPRRVAPKLLLMIMRMVFILMENRIRMTMEMVNGIRF